MLDRRLRRWSLAGAFASLSLAFAGCSSSEQDPGSTPSAGEGQAGPGDLESLDDSLKSNHGKEMSAWVSKKSKKVDPAALHANGKGHKHKHHRHGHIPLPDGAGGAAGEDGGGEAGMGGDQGAAGDQGAGGDTGVGGSQGEAGCAGAEEAGGTSGAAGSEDTAGAGGEGGCAGTAGEGGAAGESGGSGGEGGCAGDAGSAGSAGEETAGSGGCAGDAGAAGSSDAGAGGSGDAGASGAGGASGGGGAGGEGGAGGACSSTSYGQILPDKGPTGGVLTQFNGVDWSACQLDTSLCGDFASRDQVYIDSGNFGSAGLSPGKHFFVVVAPGYEQGGFAEGAVGNLSDTTAGGLTCDLGSGDTEADRTFTVPDVPQLYLDDAGTHLPGSTLSGFQMIQVGPFDSTPDGLYTLAICKVGATSSCDCVFESFHVKSAELRLLLRPAPGALRGPG